MKNWLVVKASAIIQKLDFSSSRKPGAPRKYNCGSKNDFSWIAEPDRPARKYDSSLSSPGRLCPNQLCRRFISGKPRECPSCLTMLRAVIVAMLLFSSRSSAQMTMWPWGIADSSVREFLASSWDTVNVNQTERGFCAMFTVEETPFYPAQGAAYRVYRLRLIMPMKSSAADPQSITFACPNLPNVVRVHVHPPTTCESGHCHWGGQLAWQCEPSPQDVRLLIKEDQAFGALQCARDAITFWGFKEFRPAPAKRLTQ